VTEDLSTLALLREVTTKAVALVRKELELARVELRQDARAEIRTVEALAAAGALGIASLALFLVAAVFGLAHVMPAWAAALLVAGSTAIVAFVAGAIGWSRRVREPLAITRKTLEEDVEWAKERMS
jgi:uncharacterized membrane protein YqjE